MKIHETMMKNVFALATKGQASVSPNPMVGAILVKNEKIIGQGYHKKSGEAHAEVLAIQDAKNHGHDIFGSTLYCNLEPCSHLNKKTPPCAPQIIQSGIKQVFIANLDSNPEVSGRGIELLKKSGILVECGILESEGRILNEVFFKYIQTKTPFVHLKIAQSIDGKIATASGDSKYITSLTSLEEVHKLRKNYDAVLIGSNTFLNDNPLLSVRNVENLEQKQPFRVLISKLHKIKLNYSLVSDQFSNKTIIFCDIKCVQKNPEIHLELTKRGVQVYALESDSEGKLSLTEILKTLGTLKVTSLLVEGGADIFNQFIQQSLYDKISFFIAPVLIGNGYNSVADLNINKVKDSLKFSHSSFALSGSDIVFTGYNINSQIGEICSQA